MLGFLGARGLGLGALYEVQDLLVIRVQGLMV